MDRRLLREFQSQVLLQCEFMLRASNDLNAALSTPSFDTAKAVFYAIQNFLNAAANISKALWGEGGRWAGPRQPLRDSIGITDASPLHAVTMRNNFEHFDERLDTWWRDSSRHNLADVNVTSGGIVGFDDIDILRLFDPITTDVIFWGQRFNLQKLIHEVGCILPRLTAELAKS